MSAATVAPSAGRMPMNVITSYSIHYTKLYDNEGKTNETLSKYVDYIGYIHVADAVFDGDFGKIIFSYRMQYRSEYLVNRVPLIVV